MLGIMAVMDQKDSVIVVVMAVAYAWLILLVSLSSRCVSFFHRQAQDAWHLVWYGPEGQFCSEFAAALFVECDSGMVLLGVLVDAVRAVILSGIMVGWTLFLRSLASGSPLFVFVA